MALTLPDRDAYFDPARLLQLRRRDPGRCHERRGVESSTPASATSPRRDRKSASTTRWAARTGRATASRSPRSTTSLTRSEHALRPDRRPGNVAASGAAVPAGSTCQGMPGGRATAPPTARPRRGTTAGGPLAAGSGRQPTARLPPPDVLDGRADRPAGLHRDSTRSPSGPRPPAARRASTASGPWRRTSACRAAVVGVYLAQVEAAHAGKTLQIDCGTGRRAPGGEPPDPQPTVGVLHAGHIHVHGRRDREPRGLRLCSAQDGDHVTSVVTNTGRTSLFNGCWVTSRSRCRSATTHPTQHDSVTTEGGWWKIATT